MSKNIFFFIVIFIFCNTIILTGCWDREELKDNGIIGAIGIDDDTNGLLVSFEVIRPKSATSGEDKEPSVYIETKGKSFTDALNHAKLKFDSRIFLPHCNEYIISQSVAKKGVLDVLDYFNREHETRRYVNLIISKDKAIDVLGVGTGLEKEPSLFHESLYKMSSKNLKSVRTRLLDFFIAFFEDGIEPVAELIQKVEKSESISKKEEKTDEKSIKKFEVSAEGLAVFLEDKLVGFLDGYETMSYNLIKGDVSGGYVVLTYPENKQISFDIMESKSKKEVIVDGKNIKTQISLKIKVSVEESSYKKDIESIEAAKLIEDKISKQIKERLQKTILHVQELESDIFGFGQILHRTKPKEWKKLKKNWNKAFSKMPVAIDVNTEIIRYGVSNEQVGRINVND